MSTAEAKIIAERIAAGKTHAQLCKAITAWCAAHSNNAWNAAQSEYPATYTKAAQECLMVATELEAIASETPTAKAIAAAYNAAKEAGA